MADEPSHEQQMEDWKRATERCRHIKELQRYHNDRALYTPVFWGGVGLFIGTGLLQLTSMAQVGENRAILTSLGAAGALVGFFASLSALKALEPLPANVAQIIEDGERPMPIRRR